MKVYVGMPPADPANKNAEAVVTVVEGATTRRLFPQPGGSFSWGRGGIYHGNLALAILTDFLGDEAKARPVYMRFAQRKIINLPPSHPVSLPGQPAGAGQPFQLSGEEIARVLQSIIEAEEGMDQIRAQISAMLPPVASEAIGRDAEGKVIAVEEKG